LATSRLDAEKLLDCDRQRAYGGGRGAILDSVTIAAAAPTKPISAQSTRASDAPQLMLQSAASRYLTLGLGWLCP
jgi:hypothetical protein